MTTFQLASDLCYIVVLLLLIIVIVEVFLT